MYPMPTAHSVHWFPWLGHGGEPAQLGETALPFVVQLLKLSRPWTLHVVQSEASGKMSDEDCTKILSVLGVYPNPTCVQSTTGSGTATTPSPVSPRNLTIDN